MITENLENQVIYLKWPKKKQNPTKHSYEERKRAAANERLRKEKLKIAKHEHRQTSKMSKRQKLDTENDSSGHTG